MTMVTDWICWSTVNLSLLLVAVEVVGDRVQTMTSGLDHRLMAVLDTTLIHGGVAGISWLIVVSGGKRSLCTSGGAIFDALRSAAIGIFVDVDHFIEARSLNLTNAMNLTRRPMFHSTSLLLMTVMTLVLLSMTSNRLLELRRIALIMVVAVGEHHLRDGTRHGIWFPPFGSTAPLPHWTYLSATVALPYCVRPWLPTNIYYTYHDVAESDV